MYVRNKEGQDANPVELLRRDLTIKNGSLIAFVNLIRKI